MNRIKLFFTTLYREDDILTAVLKRCLDTGISSISYDKGEYYMTIVFNNNINVMLWNKNKWYAWLSRGIIFDSHDNALYSYSNARPSHKIMIRLDKEITKFKLK